MAVLQIDGSAVSSTSTRNARGVVRHGGTIADSNLLTSKSLGDQLIRDDYYVHQANATGAGKILSSGTFGVMAVETFVMRRVSTTLAGVANTTLQSGASDFGHRHAIHKSERAVTTFLRALSWTVASTEAPAYTITNSNQDETFNNDHAARPTLATPGELVYKSSALTPVQADYEAKSVG